MPVGRKNCQDAKGREERKQQAMEAMARKLAVENDIAVDFESCPCDHCVDALIETIIECHGDKELVFQTLYHAPQSYFRNCSFELTGSVQCEDYLYYVGNNGYVGAIALVGAKR
jgi:hypothetical protein